MTDLPGARVRSDVDADSRGAPPFEKAGAGAFVDPAPVIVLGVYEMAQRWPFNQPGHPGLSISGDGRGCNTLTGRFQVHRLELQAGTTMVQRALVSFEQHCEGGSNMLSGCIRFEL